MIQGEGFTVNESKFDFFFGRVTSNPHNTRRSFDNLEGLRKLGIDEAAGGRERLIQIFQEGLNAPQVDEIPNNYGVTIVRKVESSGGEAVGAIEISYFYIDGNLNLTPEITTIITKIYEQE